MREEMNTQTKAKLAIVAVVAVALLGIAAPLALADGVGAPTSAAGGVSAPSSPSRPGAVGPLGGTNGSSAVGGSGSSTLDYDYEPLKLAPPGTGKFDDPKSPCTGTTGFGSSSAQPGHGC
ncbi:hypothetical protein [Dongia sp. agr-C8]